MRFKAQNFVDANTPGAPCKLCGVNSWTDCKHRKAPRAVDPTLPRDDGLDANHLATTPKRKGRR